MVWFKYLVLSKSLSENIQLFHWYRCWTQSWRVVTYCSNVNMECMKCRQFVKQFILATGLNTNLMAVVIFLRFYVHQQRTRPFLTQLFIFHPDDQTRSLTACPNLQSAALNVRRTSNWLPGGGKHFNFFALKIIQRITEKDDAYVIVMTALCCVYTQHGPEFRQERGEKSSKR